MQRKTATVAARTRTARTSMKKTTTKRSISSASRSKTANVTKKIADLVGLASKADVNGSYTGKPVNASERPVQDADDL